MERSKKPKITSNFLLILLIAVLGFSMIWQTAGKIYKNYELQQRVNRLEAEIAVLELQNQNMRYSIEYYKTDTYLELQAREKFNKAAPGESVALLPKDLSTPTTSQTEEVDNQVDQPQYKSNFSAWMDFLFGDAD